MMCLDLKQLDGKWVKKWNKQTDGHRLTKGEFLNPCPFVFLSCPYTIYSPISQAISNLSIDLDFLGQARGNKNVCKVMGPKINIFHQGPFFQQYYLPSNSRPFVCLINVLTHFCQRNSHLSTDLDFGSQARPNKIICNVKNLLPYPSPYPKGEIIWCRRHQYKRVLQMQQWYSS